jgi:RND family efflux transporter MFP subunit
MGGEPLFRLGRGGEIEMRGLVAEQDLPRLAVGQGASVRVTGAATPYKGQVRLLGAVIDAQNRMGSIKVSLPLDRNLRPGAFARGEVTVGQAKRPVLPQTAVLTDLKGNYVLVVGDDNSVQRRNVKVEGTRNAGVVINSGLTGSERVVATAAAFLREGEKVRAVGVKS